ncbi:MAG: hypothetical protein HKN33_10770 [Pyrinomonadaceae bacterium]|nr:hypothetical protein [Pyrinomonadaceae bacterium]
MPELDLGETKGVCEVAYDGEEGDRYRFPDGSTWAIQEARSTWSTGFKGVVVAPEEDRDITVLAFAGTDSLLDVGVDIVQIAGGLPPQYSQALIWARIVSASTRSNLVLAGHSLGGALAAYCSVSLRCPACTINPATLVGGISIASLRSNPHITNYIAANEFVSSAPGRNPGTDVVVPSAGGNLSFFTDHSLSAIGPSIPLPVKL